MTYNILQTIIKIRNYFFKYFLLYIYLISKLNKIIKYEIKLKIITLLILILTISCTSHNSGTKVFHWVNERKNRKPIRHVLLKNIPPDGRYIYYNNKKYSKIKFKKIKQHELFSVKKRIKKLYNLPFKYYQTKYFTYVYRCNERRFSYIKKSVELFYKSIYKKYFIYNLKTGITLVLFKNFNELKQKTGLAILGKYDSPTNSITSYANTGIGTIWHELIHAFIDANLYFKDRPPQQWFNEGLASFYEYAVFSNGKIVGGFANWRMPRLHFLIRTNRFGHLSRLMMRLGLMEQYGYSKARFIFCYLYSHGKIEEYVKYYLYKLMPKYEGFVLGKQAIKALEKIMNKDINTINSEYKRLAMKLYPGNKLPQKY